LELLKKSLLEGLYWGGMRRAFVCCLFLFLVALPLHAQLPTIPLGADYEKLTERQVSFEVSPEFPKPREVVGVRIETYSFEIRYADTTWYVNGQMVEDGVGIQEITFPMKDLKTAMTVRIVATLGGETIDRSTVVRSSSVELIQEPETYTPSWYKGKALPIDGAEVRIVAIPNIWNRKENRLYRSDELVFQWKAGGSPVSQGSRNGSGAITVSPKQFRPVVVEALVSVKGSTETIGKGVEAVHAENPLLRLYLEDPLAGIRDQLALSSIIFKDDEAVLVGVPFFFRGFPGERKDVVYHWRINNVETETGDTVPWKITLRGAGASATEARVELEAWDGTSFFEHGFAESTIRFER
jgi:hypothetical protein